MRSTRRQLSEKELSEKWRKAGLCGKCGKVQTHKRFGLVFKTPLVRARGTGVSH